MLVILKKVSKQVMEKSFLKMVQNILGLSKIINLTVMGRTLGQMELLIRVNIKMEKVMALVHGNIVLIPNFQEINI